MLKVSETIQKKLLGMPESGMGFQVVDAVFSDYSRKECVILNATLAEPTNNRSVQTIMDSISLEEANRVEKFASPSKEIIDVVGVKTDKGLFKAYTLKESNGAHRKPEELTKSGEEFVRFSRFENDMRIDRINKKVLPGTYATTREDATYCLGNKIDPVARYALPGTMKVKYAFYIKPLGNTLIKRGTVEPANNQPGGGAEVIFTKGTDNNTVGIPPQQL